MIMAKKKSTETSENAVVNQENKEPKKKQEDILLEMIQRYRISHTKNGIFIHGYRVFNGQAGAAER